VQPRNIVSKLSADRHNHAALQHKSHTVASSLQLELDDVLGSMQHARRSGDLGRLVLLTYWEVRKWARFAHRDALAALAADVVNRQPFASRNDLLALVDQVIGELELIRTGQR
jgi:hypothetical protein